MLWTYDADADALYIKLSDAPVASTEQVASTCFVDRDADKRVRGIEVLAVSAGVAFIISDLELSQFEADLVGRLLLQWKPPSLRQVAGLSTQTLAWSPIQSSQGVEIRIA